MKIPELVGVLNITPDSFSDGGDYLAKDQALAHAHHMAADGAAIIDIGGESTRPGADPVTPQQECDRIMPIVEALVADGLIISVDSRHAMTQQAALSAGVAMINDVSALTHDPASLPGLIDQRCDIVLMHTQGAPKTMQDRPHYDDVVAEVLSYLHGRVDACVAAGIDRSRLILDPGVGFGKTLDNNLALFNALRRFTESGLKLFIGASRKRFIAALDREGEARHRLGGSIAAALWAAQAGAHYVRVHDVAETRQALAVWQALNNSA